MQDKITAKKKSFPVHLTQIEEYERRIYLNFCVSVIWLILLAFLQDFMCVISGFSNANRRAQKFSRYTT